MIIQELVQQVITSLGVTTTTTIMPTLVEQVPIGRKNRPNIPQCVDGYVFLTVTSSDNVGNFVVDSSYSCISIRQFLQHKFKSLMGVEIFFQFDSTIRLIPTTQNWPGVWMNYTLEYNGATIFTGNAAHWLN